MTLRRSARLSAISKTKTPSVQQNAESPSRARHNLNGITKTRGRGRSARGKRSPPEDSSVGTTPQSRRTAAATSATSTTSSGSTRKQLEGFDEPDNTNNEVPSTRANKLHTPTPPLDRPVEHHRTNATLLTPHGSSLVTTYPYPPETEAKTSPSRIGLPPPTATTGTLLEKAISHLLATDPRLKPIIDKYPCCPLFSPAGLAEEIDPFRSLVSSIIAQQVSGPAAKSIRDRFVALFDDNNNNNTSNDAATETDNNELFGKKRFPTPSEVAGCDLPTLRTAGLSQRKAEYIHGLAGKFACGELSAEMLLKASDEELTEKLTAVRGLGKWSVEMFACFALKRIDVFSTGDLGVQ